MSSPTILGWPSRSVSDSLDEATALTMQTYGRTVFVNRDERIFAQGDAGGSVYLVTSGKIKISRRTPRGTHGLLAVFGPGRVFGELAALDGGPRSASAHAITDVTLEELTEGRFAELLHDRPDVAFWLLRNLARRQERASDVVTDRVYTEVPTRVAQIVIHLADEFGSDQDDGVEVEHGLTQAELAQLAGATRESVNKALSSFARKDWVVLRSRSLRINDLEALQRRAD